MDIIKFSEKLRRISVSVWGILWLLLSGLDKLIPPLFTYENNFYLYIILINIKFIAMLLFLFTLNWRGIYLIRLNGAHYHQVLELSAGIVLSIFLIGLPFYIENLFKSNDSKFIAAIEEAKTSSLIIMCVVIVAIVAALLWSKNMNAKQTN
jgi:hypothetical protein